MSPGSNPDHLVNIRLKWLKNTYLSQLHHNNEGMAQTEKRQAELCCQIILLAERRYLIDIKIDDTTPNSFTFVLSAKLHTWRSDMYFFMSLHVFLAGLRIEDPFTSV